MNSPSPIKAEMVAEAAIRFGEIHFDKTTGSIYWVETRPAEKGRSTVMQYREGAVKDILPQEFNARTRVHEYGGGAIAVTHGILYFVHHADQYLYALDLKTNQISLVLGKPNCRYADFHFFDDGFFCVREEHEGSGEPQNTLVYIDLKTGKDQVVVSGDDFYSSPRVSHDGNKLAWLSWNHPQLPWEGTTLYTAELQKDKTIRSKKVAAGGVDESVFQPEWALNGDLFYVSDRTGWWNLYRSGDPLCPMDAEFGLPQWVFGMSTYAIINDETIACVYRKREGDHLALLDLRTKKMTEISLPYRSLSGLKCWDQHLAMYAGSASHPNALLVLDLEALSTEIIRYSMQVKVDPKLFSTPQAIAFPTAHNQTAYALFYPPPKERELPPLVLHCHGGPTAQCGRTLNLEIQFWTTRGFAYLDLDYAGSSGYGREYRNRLKGKWGVADVEDCVHCVRYLTGQGMIDPKRVVIKGGSAGGYTVLRALTATSIFCAGASYYGVSDLESLVKETHKFEAHYLDGLIAPYPEGKEIYIERSPLHHLDRLQSPLLLLQGMQDKVVLPKQSEMMFEALKKRGMPVAYLTFENEQHGFRRAENIQRALEAELYFYSQVLKIPVFDKIDPITIENLP